MPNTVRARRRNVKSEQRIDQCGFSGAVRAQQPDGLAAQLAGQTVKDDPAAEPHLQSIQLDDAHVLNYVLGRHCSAPELVLS